MEELINKYVNSCYYWDTLYLLTDGERKMSEEMIEKSITHLDKAHEIATRLSEYYASENPDPYSKPSWVEESEIDLSDYDWLIWTFCK